MTLNFVKGSFLRVNFVKGHLYDIEFCEGTGIRSQIFPGSIPDEYRIKTNRTKQTKIRKYKKIIKIKINLKQKNKVKKIKKGIYIRHHLQAWSRVDSSVIPMSS